MKQCTAWLVAGVAVVLVAGCGGDAPDSAASASGVAGIPSSSGASGVGGAHGGTTSAGAAGQPAAGGDAAGTSYGGQPAAGSAGALAGGSGGATWGGSGGVTSGGSGGASSGGSGGASSGGSGGASSGGSGGGGALGMDVFGIPMLKPSRAPALLWTSQHWSTGGARALSGRDPTDPTGWSIRRGDTSAMNIDGQGVMSMGGAQPRFYVMPKTGEKVPFFRDIEFTGYYRRTANDGAFNAGFVVGMRSHPEGHGSDTCNTTTYYLAFRNSGTYLFDKELNHPNDSPGKGGQLFSPSHSIPVGKWIGMKYLVYNLPGDKAVKLETYIDADSDGNGTKASDWKKVGETVDDGNWPAPAGNCGFPENTVVTEGGGVVFIRNTDVGKVEYQKLSWREITN